ncbi:MAG: bifunctional 5,10-methylenetetrahydrofolate dehydrogenase/5,10-methenyltetrahydrofolate cyclohydrolase [Patescibacteria group bacterium]|nr:bifunctional 5,10-methylenetetrahydrofolate dehydrogenase/5,10-methenyltetrahydrofolate cyclohydrolase [Patescibacteria group bacterium]MDE2116495.1 bifunctional 5,10-methylenetetrahydrofolate dehydrogenase/5,10-methenyltetrahydrofolate cyclohydrolase [Patescibacteria group bacterium]
MTVMLDGRKARDSYKVALKERSDALVRAGIKPRLAIIQIGDNSESSVYIEQKKKFGAEVGAAVDHVKFASDMSEKDVSAAIAELNARGDIHGIIVQLPLPAGFDVSRLVGLVAPEKDVDGLVDGSAFMPATAKGVMMLLDFYGVEPRGKMSVVFGRSRLVGQPIASALRTRGASVSVCHSQTPNPKEISRAADIVVVAIGKRELIDASYIKDGAVVVDVGMHAVVDGGRRLVGDVDRASVAPKASAITPVPGGVGPMTVLALFDNLISSAERLSAHKNLY